MSRTATYHSRRHAARERAQREGVLMPRPGQVCRVLRHSGIDRVRVAEYTGQTTPSGRLRFRLVDAGLYESKRFACLADAVVEIVADDLAEYFRRNTRVRGVAQADPLRPAGTSPGSPGEEGGGS